MNELLLGAHRSSEPVLDITTAPLVAGSATNGYYGTLTAEEFYNAAQLVNSARFPFGTIMNQNGAWLHFTMAGKHVLVAKVPVMSGFSPQQMIDQGWLDGTGTMRIKGKTYKLRLLTGTTGANTVAAGGEWNSHMYNVCSARPSGTAWANFTPAELGIQTSAGAGSYTLCRDKTSAVNYCLRGFAIGSITATAPSTSDARWAWRPVFELA